MVSGKDSSNPLMADNLPKIIWYSTHHVALMKSWLVQKQTALGRKFNFSKYIFDSLVRNVDISTKFYIYLQLMIRAQVGDLSSHTTKYSPPALTQKVFANMRRVGKGFFRVDTPLFEGMKVARQDDDAADEGVASVVVDDVPTAVDEPSIPSPTPTTQPPPPSQDLPSTSQVQPTPPPSPIAQPPSPQKHPQPPQSSHDAEIPMDLLHTLLETCITLTRRVKHLEQDKIAQSLEITKLNKGVDTSEDTVMDDVSKQGRIIANIDADEDVTLKDVANIAKEVALDAKIKESVLSIQDDEIELAELKEVVEVVTSAKLMTEVVTAASVTISAAATLIPTTTITVAPGDAKRRKGVVIRDPEETATPSIIIHSEPKSKVKGKRIMVEEPKPLKKQAQIEQDEAYAREFKMDYFKGMSYDDTRPIFKKKFNSSVDFLEKTREQLEEEGNKELKRISESQAEKATKKQNLDEEVEELKRHLHIVTNDDDDDDDDDVCTEAPPLARKVPVVDYEIYTENEQTLLQDHKS
nr:hypothetical protein [Tanacetum cinerariifolium]